jgi:hypothetical protein
VNHSARALSRRAAATIVLLALVVSACVSGDAEPTTSVVTPVTSGAAETTVTTTTDPAETTSTTLPVTLPAPTTTLPPDAADPATREQLGDQIAQLIADAERLRGLSFVVPLEVLIVTPQGYSSRAFRAFDGSLNMDQLDGHTDLYHLTKVLPDDADLEMLRRDLFSPQTRVFYDWGSGALIVRGDTTELSAPDRASVIHEVVHALTDQLFTAGALRQEMRDDAADDRATSVEALIEGDATYFELLYIQELPLAEQQDIALAVADDDRAVGLPRVAADEFAFPFEHGVDFAAGLVRGGGIAAVDRSYLRPPPGTRMVLHPEQQLRGEVPAPVTPIEAEVPGYAAQPAASLGEFGLRQILSGTLSPGLLTQTVNGWVGDSYVLYTNPAGETAFAYRVAGNGEDATIAITQAFIALTENRLRAGNAVNADGGVLYRGNGYYVFLDRVDSELTAVIATDEEAGALLREQIAPVDTAADG